MRKAATCRCQTTCACSRSPALNTALRRVPEAVRPFVQHPRHLLGPHAVLRRDEHGHTRKPLRATVADRLHRSEHPGKNLSVAAHLDARLDHIANPGDPDAIAGRDNLEPRRFDPGFLQDSALDRTTIDG